MYIYINTHKFYNQIQYNKKINWSFSNNLKKWRRISLHCPFYCVSQDLNNYLHDFPLFLKIQTHTHTHTHTHTQSFVLFFPTKRNSKYSKLSVYRPAWMESKFESEWIHVYGWVSSLCTRNYHNIVNHLYPNIKIKVKKIQ